MTRRLQRIWLSATLVLAPSLAAPPVHAAPAADEAEYVRDVVGRAAAHVEQRRYAEALAVLDQAERERPLPVFLYVRATIEERRGNCEGAVALYRRFLALDVPAKDAEDARRGVQRCEGEPARVPEPEVVPAPATTDPAATEVSPSSDPSRTDRPPPRPWYADPWGGALVGVGVVGVGVGVGLVVRSRIDARAAADATGLQTFDDRSLRAVALDRAGIATMAVGGALLVAGAIRYTLVGTRERRRVALVPGALRRGGGVRVVVRF